MALRKVTDGVDEASAADDGVDLWDVSSTPTYVRTLPAVDGLVVWTLRAVGDRLLGVVKPASGGTVVAVWDDTAGTLVALHAISSAQSAVNVATVYDEGGTLTAAYVCYAGGVWAAVSTEYAGVVPYADFADMSAAAALRELAIISAAHFWVDADRIGHLIGRESTRITGQEPVEIDTPLERKERGNWEWYRRSVVVSGEDEDGGEIKAVAGEAGDSETRLEVSAQLPLTLGLASAIAAAYLTYLSVQRVQLDETLEEPTSGPLRLLGVATRDGHSYQVLRAESLTLEREQTVQLVEIGG